MTSEYAAQKKKKKNTHFHKRMSLSCASVCVLLRCSLKKKIREKKCVGEEKNSLEFTASIRLSAHDKIKKNCLKGGNFYYLRATVIRRVKY